MNKKLKFAVCLILSLVLLVATFVLALCLGAEKIRVLDALRAGDKFSRIILLNLRLPRALLVLVTGVLLGASGAVFQLFFRNPLAEPGIMGISSGATLGAVIASVGGIGSTVFKINGIQLISPINLFAFAGALLSGTVVTVLAFSRAGKNSSVMLLLCGTALGTLYSSVSSLLLLTSDKELHSVYSWILGSFNGRGWNELIFILIPAVLAMVIFFVLAPQLDLLSGGEKTAGSLGVQVDRLRVLVLISGSLAVSAAVCAGGTISFVGLIAPHIVRKAVGAKGKVLLPFSMLLGAILLLLSDTLARVLIAPAELPAGILMGILGVPFFLSLVLGKSL